MPKIPLVAGFKDPARRPRYIIWTGVGVLLMAAVVIVALGVTSTYWFCANGCHKVQDDTITAYNASTHNKISCMACHMPVNSDPITFLLHKAEALGELYLTATNQYEIPLNGHSHVALEMPEGQCTQCHSENRVITPSEGIIIDHEIHHEEEVTCTLCHNRIAHNEEDMEFVNVDPTTGELNTGHDDFMTMTACFRCHSQEDDGAAPGACGACHPADFELKPESHFEEDFYPRGHADLALEDQEAVSEAMSEGEHGESDEEGDGHSEETTESEEGSEPEEGSGEEGTDEDGHEGDESSMLGLESANASGGGENPWVEAGLPSVGEVSYCSTCHSESFCMNCHGMEMPHPQEFIDTTHPEVAAEKMDKCDLCHQVYSTEFLFCNDCHHGSESDWEYDPAVEWQTQHAAAVTDNGIDICLEACHDTKFCSDCHTQLKPVPTSHAAADFLRKPAEELGTHAEGFNSQPTACEICHGEGMPNDNAFCRGCHVLEVPHPEEFKEFHAKTGRESPAVCANCHTYKELCSDCHHEGAIDGTPWLNVHGGVVNENGADSCFEKCHEDQSCVSCHTANNVVPASHNQAGWTRRVNLETPAVHPEVYGANADSCTYCHGEGGVESAFCSGCHGVEMPHPEGSAEQGFDHAEGLAGGELNRASCQNCHVQAFCDGCHHEYTGQERWVTYHDQTVREDGAAGCFDCHEEVYCSNCHVRRAADIIGGN